MCHKKRLTLQSLPPTSAAQKRKTNEMKTSTFKTLLLTAAVSASGTSAFAQIPDGYYDSLKGKKGAELKTALHNIIKNANVLDYGSGTGAT